MPSARELIEETRELIGEPPRRLGLLAGWRVGVRRPSWMGDDDGLLPSVRAAPRLLREGRVVWGALVQANKLLFEPGPSDSPAMAIYCRDRELDDDPLRLRRIAHEIFALKETEPDDPRLREAARQVTDEMDRGVDFRVPKVLTGGPDVRTATIMVYRKHLPHGHIDFGFFPLLLHDDIPAAMIVPHRWWPPRLKALW